MKYLDRDTSEWVTDDLGEPVALNKDLFWGTSGPTTPGGIMIVGEAWGLEEDSVARPFVGQSGKELQRMCLESGIDWNNCFLTNVVSARPSGNEMWRFFYSTDEAKHANHPALRGLHPRTIIIEGLSRLEEQVRKLRPSLIIACGNYALWALTNCTSTGNATDAPSPTRVPTGIDSWRGSQWFADALPNDLVQTKVLPIFHPASILRAWYNRACTVHDLRTRVPLALNATWRPSPAPVFLAPPTFDVARATLQKWLDRADSGETFRLLSDIETNRSIITVCGFADSPSFGIAIPWVKDGTLAPYWTLDEELVLFTLIRKILLHRNILIEGQNYSYDVQYFRRYYAAVPKLAFDSMLAHHLLFPGTPKDLGYLSSLYCAHHWYWKDDGKEWAGKGTVADLCLYNAWDCVRNFEINTTLRGLIQTMGMTEQWEEVIATAHLLQKMMFRGVRIDRTRRARLAFELADEASRLGAWFNSIIPQSIFTGDKKNPTPWYQSSSQQRETFLNEFGFSLPNHKKTGKVTFGKEALSGLKSKHPEFARLFNTLGDFRSLRVFKSTFVDAPLDIDDRMRCSYNPAGTETFRFNSSENAFGSGTNLQNIPKGNEDKE